MILYSAGRTSLHLVPDMASAHTEYSFIFNFEQVSAQCKECSHPLAAGVRPRLGVGVDGGELGVGVLLVQPPLPGDGAGWECRHEG